MSDEFTLDHYEQLIKQLSKKTKDEYPRSTFDLELRSTSIAPPDDQIQNYVEVQPPTLVLKPTTYSDYYAKNKNIAPKATQLLKYHVGVIRTYGYFTDSLSHYDRRAARALFERHETGYVQVTPLIPMSEPFCRDTVVPYLSRHHEMAVVVNDSKTTLIFHNLKRSPAVALLVLPDMCHEIFVPVFDEKGPAADLNGRIMFLRVGRPTDFAALIIDAVDTDELPVSARLLSTLSFRPEEKPRIDAASGFNLATMVSISDSAAQRLVTQPALATIEIKTSQQDQPFILRFERRAPVRQLHDSMLDRAGQDTRIVLLDVPDFRSAHDDAHIVDSIEAEPSAPQPRVFTTSLLTPQANAATTLDASAATTLASSDPSQLTAAEFAASTPWVDLEFELHDDDLQSAEHTEITDNQEHSNEQT